MVKYIKKYSEIIFEKNRINLELMNLEKKINKVIKVIHKKLSKSGKILLCGNGGSAADAQHLAAEFLIRLRPNINRNPIPAISLAMDTSVLTACSNDYNFKYVFSRNLHALGSKNKDVLIAISTSGNSKNIIEALKAAKKKKYCLYWFFWKNRRHSSKIL